MMLRKWVKVLRQRTTLLLAALILMVTWVTVSPVGSDPDGSFHLNSIWCGQGTRAGICEDPPLALRDTRPKTINTPLGVREAGQCFAYKADISAACESDTLSDASMVPNQQNNQGRLYPNAYYWVASHFVGQNVEVTAILVRMLNVLLMVLLLVLLAVTAHAAIFRSVLVSLFILWVPLGLFLVASNNGSSWTLTGVGVFWAFLWTTLHEKRRTQQVWSAVGGIIAALMAVGSRVDGALFIALSAGVVVFLTWNRLPTARHRSIGVWVVITIAGVAVWSYLTAGQGGSLTSGLNAGETFSRSAVQILWANIARLPGFFLGMFGLRGFGGGLGKQETSMETLTWVSMVGVLIALIARTRYLGDLRHRWGLVALTGAAVIMPMYMLFLDRAIVGENVQSRYVLPLVTVAFALFIVPSLDSEKNWSLTGYSRTILSVLVTVAHAMALHTNMRRYISGRDVRSPDLNAGREWWPEWLLPPNIMWMIGSLAMGLIAYIVFFVELGPADDTSQVRIHEGTIPRTAL